MYNARFYDAQLARFISADTLVPEPGSVKAYDRFSYVNGNPINFNDPSGHCIWDGCIVEVMIIAAVLGASFGYGSQVYSNYQTFGYSGKDAWTENISAEPIINGAILAPAIPLMAPEVLADAGYGLWSAGQSIGSTGLGARVSSLGTSTFATSISLTNYFSGPPLETTSTDLYRFGGSPQGQNPGVKPPRVGTDLFPDKKGNLLPTFKNGIPTNGISTFANPKTSGLTGNVYRLPSGTILPKGIGIVADGKDVIPSSPNPIGHYSLYPSMRMSTNSFISKINSLNSLFAWFEKIR